MKVAFFLVPKSEVAWMSERVSLGRAISELQRSGHGELPVLAEDGRYVGTVTEGELLRELLRTPSCGLAALERKRLSDLPRRDSMQAVGIDAELEELLTRAIDQKFVPVVDGRGVFIGIVRRREVLAYCAGAFGADPRLAPSSRAEPRRNEED